MNEEFTSGASQTPKAPKPPQKPISGKKILRAALIGIAVIFVLVLFATSWYTVDDKQQAVVTTFGKVTSVTDAGFHFMLPLGIQQVEKVDVNVYQNLQLGYRSGTDETESVSVESEAKMITGDYNIVNVDFFIEYKVSDPVQYLYGSYEPELVLRNLVQSQVRNVVGSTNVDSVLTDGKEAIQMQVKELIMDVLEEYDIGLMLIDVKIQDSEPPTEAVTQAFKDVETAKQQAETVINEARAYQNAELPAAEAESDKLVQNAEYLKQKRINEAIEQVAMFEAMYQEYTANPDLTRIRMYYEALTEMLPEAKLYLDLSDGGVEKLLPLDSLVDSGKTSTTAAPTPTPTPTPAFSYDTTTDPTTEDYNG